MNTLRTVQRLRLTVRVHLKSQTRFYATHRDAYPTSTPPPTGTPSLLSQLPSRSDTSNVGPFALQLDRSPASSEDTKPWSQLNAAQRVRRTTARTTNFSVIIAGAGLSAIIVYALATELFARNSPTVLYGEICEKLKASSLITSQLHPPLIFHNNPPSLHVPRHRGRQVPAQIVVDSAGREHLIFRFWVEGKGSRPTLASEPPDDPEDPLWDRALKHARKFSVKVADQSRRAFAFLVGEPLPAAPTTPKTLPAPAEPVTEEKKPSGWGIAGMFSGIRGNMGGKKKAAQALELDFEGEVHVDMIKNERGDFVYQHLFVDIPSTRSARARRIYIEGTPKSGQQQIIWQ
ncbi:hypothetical protein DACRYDRAFT_116871 [Dacryopinax primogenitus]|uniref:Mitochondrial import inner membrane translocase subunit Tim21 n=1 Tax=Dacryopinax primogenitus (strain DJM 731) TaxID=1858805 RepID=M5G5D5_DACPD|nr:uncharacterized protein DACRYDRAFT_116871 [Dacryopinax primogenitus]EJU01037.1 hypothetical protein DACRYDRAFT_116871 [Dacryopinax primogenitus]